MDRRLYQRTKVNIDGVFLLNDRNIFPREFNGILEDVSENGIKIVIDPLTAEVLTSSIDINDSIHFDSYDEYHLFGKDHTALINGDVKVVRKENHNNSVVLGCMLNPVTKNFLNYVRDRETVSFINALK